MKKRVVLILSLFAMNGFAQMPGGENLSGNGAGNGGGGHLCYDSEVSRIQKNRNAEVSIEAYDLFEARTVYHLNVPTLEERYEKTKDALLESALKKVALTQPGMARDMRVVLKQMNSKNFYTDASVPMVTLPYAPPTEANRKCEYIPIVNWFDAGQYSRMSPRVVIRDEDHYSRGPVSMDILSQAATDFHEASYTVARAYNLEFRLPQLASAIRHFNGEAWSNGPITEKLIPSHEIDSGLHQPTSRDNGAYGLVVDFRDCDFNKNAFVTVTYDPSGRSGKAWVDADWVFIHGGSRSIYPSLILHSGESAKISIGEEIEKYQKFPNLRLQDFAFRLLTGGRRSPTFTVDVQVCDQKFSKKIDGSSYPNAALKLIFRKVRF